MIPSLQELPAAPRRVILHWSGGAHRANAVDLAAYHYVVEGDGTVREGRPVALNMKQIEAGTPSTAYAAHTRGLNSFSVGVSLAGMQGAQPGGTHGPAPLLAGQMDAAIQFVARCCEAWGLDPTRREHVLTHAEVEQVFGVTQANKWDITVLPWDPTVRGAKSVGGWIRRHVVAAMEPQEPPEPPDLPEPAITIPPTTLPEGRPPERVVPWLDRDAAALAVEQDIAPKTGEPARRWICRVASFLSDHDEIPTRVRFPARLLRSLLDC